MSNRMNWFLALSVSLFGMSASGGTSITSTASEPVQTYSSQTTQILNPDGTTTTTMSTTGAFQTPTMPPGATVVESQAAGQKADADSKAEVEDLNSVPDGGQPGTQPEVSRDELKSCVAAQKKAQIACATLSLLGMDPSTAGMMEGMLMQSLQVMGQMRSQGSAAQCKSQQELNKIMAAVTAAKTIACGMLMNQCEHKCRDAVDFYDDQRKAALENQKPGIPVAQGQLVSPSVITENRNRAGVLENQYRRSARHSRDTCQEYKGNMAMMVAQLMQQGMSLAMNGQCQDQLSTTATPIPGSSLSVSATPFTVPTPSQYDCSDPKFAQNNINCICMKDPNNQLCKSANANVFGTGGTTAGGVGTPTGGVGTPGDLPSDGQVVESGAGSKPTTGSQTSGDNGGGGLGGGGGGMGNFGSDGPPGPSDINKNVITGQSGGGGGGSGGGFAATSGGGGGGGKGSGSGDGAGGGFNLSKFLPKDAKRGLAGMSIEAKDGVTGPMGPSLWEKVSNQYQNQKNSLYQDR